MSRRGNQIGWIAVGQMTEKESLMYDNADDAEDSLFLHDWVMQS